MRQAAWYCSVCSPESASAVARLTARLVEASEQLAEAARVREALAEAARVREALEAELVVSRDERTRAEAARAQWEAATQAMLAQQEQRQQPQQKQQHWLEQQQQQQKQEWPEFRASSASEAAPATTSWAQVVGKPRPHGGR